MVKLKTDNQQIHHDSEKHELRDAHEVRDHDDSRAREDNRPLIEREHAVVDEELQHRQFGGLHPGSAFFGWLVSSGLATILLALVAATGTTLALTKVTEIGNVTTGEVATFTVVSGLILAAILFLAYYAGGYVAGRMSRFDGGRQGVGVWAIGVIMTLVLGGAAAVFGSQYNILANLNLPYVPVNGEVFTAGGLLAAIVAMGVSLLGAWLGGKTGTRYHRKVDAAGTIEHTVFASRRQAHGH